MSLAKSEAAPDDPVAQDLAEAWWNMVLDVTKGDAELLHTFVQIHEERASWPEGDRELIDASQPFIDLSVKHYLKSRSIDCKGLYNIGTKTAN